MSSRPTVPVFSISPNSLAASPLESSSGRAALWRELIGAVDRQPETYGLGVILIEGGRVYRLRPQGTSGETVVFEYAPEWLADPDRFSIEPALALTRGGFAPPAGQASFGSIGDSAPDTWGRRLMQRAERRLAEREGRAVRTLAKSDYLLGVADETRLGALHFRWAGEDVFQAPLRAGVPALIQLGRLLQVTERILREEETDEDLQLILGAADLPATEAYSGDLDVGSAELTVLHGCSLPAEVTPARTPRRTVVPSLAAP